MQLSTSACGIEPAMLILQNQALAGRGDAGRAVKCLAGTLFRAKMEML